jgi:hypothetical protein
MNPITFALNRIVKYGIPKPILQMTFLSRHMVDRYTLDTLESQIRTVVVEDRVLEDLNIVHGTQITVPLADCKRLDGDFYTGTWYVPKELTGGKKITSVYHLTQAAGMISTQASANNSQGIYTSTFTSFSKSGALFGAAQQLSRSVEPVHVVSNALCYLIGENTVHIKDTVIVPATMHLRVVVENDDNLNHIQIPYYTVIHELIEEAVKSYIYNNLTLEQDNVFINSGGELNKFRDIVESYSDSEAIYREKLEETYKSLALNDSESWRRHYQSRCGGSW